MNDWAAYVAGRIAPQPGSRRRFAWARCNRPRPGTASCGPGAGVGKLSANGRSVPRCARRAEPQQVLRECPMTPYAADPTQAAAAACRLSDSGREHGFGAPRLPALRFVRTARECPRPRLQRHAPRLGGFMTTGGFPGCRVATRIRAAAAWPFELSEPASGSEWPVVPGAGRLSARHRDGRDTALDCAFRRPRRLQPTTLPVAAPWMAAPYHPVTRDSLEIFLAISLPPLARRPILAPVTTRFAPIRPLPPAGVVTGMRVEPHPSPRRPNDARDTSHRPRPSHWPALVESLPRYRLCEIRHPPPDAGGR